MISKNDVLYVSLIGQWVSTVRPEALQRFTKTSPLRTSQEQCQAGHWPNGCSKQDCIVVPPPLNIYIFLNYYSSIT